ncbi:helix-turn-helix domain-containing protein [Tissierella carlieri]|uniref:Helix-turn-helix domain-containing protein n=1 Tax=Tissierella carlieri TaxID=689904 RepID=A0ABT1SEB7_9FIRM|nr:helix-turn-helix domain-containing protein [Tissierella carlieri]MCQ4924833.1 helix-turn-helix domain-containing protein [Tissierella carlieri]
MIENFIDVDKRLNERMDELNLKQVDICKLSGISKNAVSNYVNGNRVPDTMSLYKLSKTLDTSMEWILTGEGVKSTKQPQYTNQIPSLAKQESDMIAKYKQFTQEDKEDIKVLIEMKYNRLIKNGTLSNCKK